MTPSRRRRSGVHAVSIEVPSRTAAPTFASVAEACLDDVYGYLLKHKLPYHPLWEQGYVSIGDVHTTRPLSEGMTEEETRFFGLKRECGLHEEAAGSGI